MDRPAETALYAPVKTLLEARGYAVKGEIGAADVVGRRGADDIVIVELKTSFSLTLLQQAVARQRLTDAVYVAVPRWRGKAGWRAFKGNLGLCKRLGVGVISVDPGTAEARVHHDPAPFQPRRSPRKRAALIAEFDARAGDPTQGGTNGTVVTSYRQDALRCAGFLVATPIAKGAEVARETGVARATRIMADNHHGWFCRVARGLYALSDAGRAALEAEEAPAPHEN